MPDWIEKIISLGGEVVNAIPFLSREASHTVINLAVGATRTRPHPWSTFRPYTSWRGLTDRSYLARHLPPVALQNLPDPKQVQELFVRPPGPQKLSRKSTCLFPAFAQYLTDGFIRTSTNPIDPAKTTSNHEIDLCPLYGRTPEQTDILRLKSNALGTRGKLKSQKINGEEYAPYLYINDGTEMDRTYAGLDPPLFGPDGAPPPARLKTLFAFGGDRANSTPFSAMMNTLLLREHNRVSGALEAQHEDWDDDRVFETARNILIPIFIKIVIEQYIHHIAPVPFKVVADPSVAWTASWNRPNWMTAEFSLLYRWHSLMPDAIKWPGSDDIPLGSFGLNNEPLTRVGLYGAFAAASAQAAAELGALNTSAALLWIEERAVLQARANQLDTYNNYCRAFGKIPAGSFSDFSTNPAIVAKLQRLYGTPDQVEFYPGLFAEDRVKNSPLPGLLMTMVAVDAFSQALTNPLLSEHVFNDATFTPWGLQLINETPSLGAIVARNVPNQVIRPIAMTQPNWRPE